MGFFGDFFRRLLAPAPPAPRPVTPDQDPGDALKDAALSAAEQLSYQAVQIYLNTAIQRIPGREKQVQVIDQLIVYLEQYRDLLDAETVDEVREEFGIPND